MGRRTAPLTRVRDLAYALLSAVRRRPALHKPLHRLAVTLARTGPGAALIRALMRPAAVTAADYQQWIARYDTLSESKRQTILARVARMRAPPLISVVMAAYGTDPEVLLAALASLRDQLYPHWELCVADDASPAPEVWRALQAAAAADPRIKVVRRDQNGHISAATNTALALASGEFVAFMDHDDLLTADALAEVAQEIERHPDADLIFTDEDKIDAQGRRFEPHLKTAWDPELMTGLNQVNHLAVYRRSLVAAVGGLRVGFEGGQDHDLALRVAERTTKARIRHVPRILYHWRQAGGSASFSEANQDRCAEASRRAVQEHLERTGQGGATAERLEGSPGWLQVRRPLRQPAPQVSILVPTRDRARLLGACAQGVLQQTDYPDLEMIVVDNGSVEPETKRLFADLARDRRVRILAAPGPFNYSALNNQAAAAAAGEVLVLLNNDIKVTGRDWLRELVVQAVRPEVGAVGARLLYRDGRVQHAGVVLGLGGAAAGHLHSGAPRHDPGYFGSLRMARNVSAVTGACLAIRRELYLAMGGLDADQLAVAFNDVDLCLRLRSAGYQVIWTPRAELLHLESASRGGDLAGEAGERFARETAVMRERWGMVLGADPWFNPNFDLAHGGHRLGEPRAAPRPHDGLNAGA